MLPAAAPTPPAGSPFESFVLWEGGRQRPVQSNEWSEAQQRGNGVAWVHLRGPREAAIAALAALNVSELSASRLATLLPDGVGTLAAEQGPVQRITVLAFGWDSEERVLRSGRLSILVGPSWVVTLAAAAEDGQPDPVADLVAGLDLPAYERPGAAHLGIHLLGAAIDQYSRVIEVLAGLIGQEEGPALDAVAPVQRAVIALRRPGRPPESAWFPVGDRDSAALMVARRLDDVLISATAIQTEAERAISAARRAEERKRTETLELVLGLLAAILLGPTLVAGAFAAFPEWLPGEHRSTAFLGLTLASAGLLWLLAYTAPLLYLRRHRAAGQLIAAALALGVALVGVGISIPLTGGEVADDVPPVVTAHCPPALIGQRHRVFITVAAADASSRLKTDPSGVISADTQRLGIRTTRFVAVDARGNRAVAACSYRVVAQNH